MCNARFCKIALVLVGVLVVLAAFRPSASPANTESSEPLRTINVDGQATVVATPDVAYITVGVHTQAPQATKALSDNNAQAARIFQTLADFGVAKQDIRTVQLSLYQREERNKDGKVIARYYVVDNTVQVTVRKLDQLGRVLDALVKNGANRVNNIRFDVSDRAAMLEQARLQAVKQGKTQAAALAEAAGAKLGPVQKISFQSVAPVLKRADLPMAAMSAEGGEVPVSGGQLEVRATVQMVFLLQSP